MTINRERTLKLLQALNVYGVICYRVTAHRKGENGPHLDIWKGPRFDKGLPVTASRAAKRLFAQLCSGEIQQRVNQIERKQ